MEKIPCYTQCKDCKEWFRSTLDSEIVRCAEHQRQYEYQLWVNRMNMPDDLYEKWKATGYDPTQEPSPAPGEIWERKFT